MLHKTSREGSFDGLSFRFGVPDKRYLGLHSVSGYSNNVESSFSTSTLERVRRLYYRYKKVRVTDCKGFLDSNIRRIETHEGL